MPIEGLQALVDKLEKNNRRKNGYKNAKRSIKTQKIF